MAAVDFRSLIPALREQGWTVEPNGGRWKATPADKTKPIVHVSNSSDPFTLKNIIGDLRRSGFIWEEAPSSKRVRLSRVSALPLLPPPLPPPSPVMEHETFGQALRRLRLEEGVTTETVAQLVGVTNQAVSYWETDVNIPIRDHYDLLLGIFPLLKDAPEPDSKDISKPIPGPASSSTKKLTPEPTDSETAMNSNNNPPLNHPHIAGVKSPDVATNITQQSPKSFIPQLVRLVIEVRESEAEEPVKALLQKAIEANMSVADVLEMLA